MLVVELIYLACFVMAVLFALGMVVLRNPVHCALCLIGVMLTLAAIFIVMHQFFIAAIQVIVYVGAVMALFLWVIMMLNLREPEVRPTKLRIVRTWGAIFGLVLLAMLGAALSATMLETQHVDLANAPVVPITSIARGILTKWLLPVELTSILLLIGMVGAVVLSRPLKQEEK